MAHPARKTDTELADDKKIRLAKLVFTICRGGFLTQELRLPPDPALVSLLLSVYIFSKSGSSLDKKRASALTGANDIKTARKYIRLAQDLRLIVVRKAGWDKRKDLLSPSAKLSNAVENSLENLHSDFWSIREGKHSDELTTTLEQVLSPIVQEMRDADVRAGLALNEALALSERIGNQARAQLQRLSKKT